MLHPHIVWEVEAVVLRVVGCPSWRRYLQNAYIVERALTRIEVGIHPSPAAEQNRDGSITLYFGPEKPKGVAMGNYVKTLPGRGWFQILRFYSPTKGFFDKSWRPGEVELVK